MKGGRDVRVSSQQVGLIAHCASNCSFKVERNFHLVFLFFFLKKPTIIIISVKEREKKTEAGEIFKGLEFLQCSIELCRNQSIIHLTLWLRYGGHALKSMQKRGRGTGPNMLRQHISLRNAYWRDLSLNVDFIFLRPHHPTHPHAGALNNVF